MTEGNGTNSGGIIFLAVSILVVGGMYLYQREGGRIFPENSGGQDTNESLVEKFNPPAAITEIVAREDVGPLSNDYVYTYRGSGSLENVELTFTIWYTNGKKLDENRSYATWNSGESKTINVSAWDGYSERHKITGTAERSGKKVVFDLMWDVND